MKNEPETDTEQKKRATYRMGIPPSSRSMLEGIHCWGLPRPGDGRLSLSDHIGQKTKSPTKSWLEARLIALDALYRRFGREGLKDQPLPDVRLLLAAKELQVRDAARESRLSGQQMTANRHVELEINDLTAYVKSLVAGLSLADLRPRAQYDRPQQQLEQEQSWASKNRGQSKER